MWPSWWKVDETYENRFLKVNIDQGSIFSNTSLFLEQTQSTLRRRRILFDNGKSAARNPSKHGRNEEPKDLERSSISFELRVGRTCRRKERRKNDGESDTVDLSDKLFVSSSVSFPKSLFDAILVFSNDSHLSFLSNVPPPPPPASSSSSIHPNVTFAKGHFFFLSFVHFCRQTLLHDYLLDLLLAHDFTKVVCVCV